MKAYEYKDKDYHYFTKKVDFGLKHTGTARILPTERNLTTGEVQPGSVVNVCATDRGFFRAEIVTLNRLKKYEKSLWI
jgi:hypothetical protein